MNKQLFYRKKSRMRVFFRIVKEKRNDPDFL